MEPSGERYPARALSGTRAGLDRGRDDNSTATPRGSVADMRHSGRVSPYPHLLRLHAGRECAPIQARERGRDMSRALTILTLALGYAVVIRLLVTSGRQFHSEGMARVRAGEGEGK